jgi:hypothetical protein
LQFGQVLLLICMSIFSPFVNKAGYIMACELSCKNPLLRALCCKLISHFSHAGFDEQCATEYADAQNEYG